MRTNILAPDLRSPTPQRPIADLIAFLIVVCVVAAAVGILGVPAHAGVPDEVVAPYVEVRNGDTVGSGVVLKVAGDLYVLTASHVVAGADRVELVKGDPDKETKWIADVVLRGCMEEEEGGDDLAVLKPRCGCGLTPAKLCPCVAPEAGDTCWYVGTPFGVHAQLERSVISKARHQLPGLDRDFLLIGGNGTFGSSGGPVFMSSGGTYVLVGVVVRLVDVSNPKSPILAKTPADINKFLEPLREKRCPADGKPYPMPSE